MAKIIMLNDDVNSAQSDKAEAYDKENYNESYKHFIERGQEKGLDIIIAHTSDFIGKGKVAAGWTREKGVWRKTSEENIGFLYDKFPATTPKTKTIKKEIQDVGIGILNNPVLEEVCKNKLKNYHYFEDIIIPTYHLGIGFDEAKTRINMLKSNAHLGRDEDYDKEKIVIKPANGFGGKGVHVIEGDEFGILNSVPIHQYIVQAFLETSEGIPELNIEGRHDFRVIVANGEIKQAYVRVNAKDSYVSNQEKGGRVQYVSLDDIPNEVREKASIVDKTWSQINPRIFSLDFGRGRSGAYHGFEMNAKPGQVWDQNDPIDIENTKVLQDIILDCLYEANTQ